MKIAVWSAKTSLLVRSVLLLLAVTVFSWVAGSASMPARDSTALGSPPDSIIQPSLSVFVPESSVIEAVPSAEGDLYSKDVPVTVTTNLVSGYRLSMNTATVDQCLKHKSVRAEDCNEIADNQKIKALENTNTLAVEFPFNSWGVSMAPAYDVWNPIPASGEVGIMINNSTSSGPTEVSTIKIGARANTSIWGGDYSGDVVFSVIANPIPVPAITSISPTSGSAGTEITLVGANLDHLFEVTIGGAACVGLNIVSVGGATCSAPDLGIGAEGEKTLALTSVFGDTNSVAPTFTYELQELTFDDFTIAQCDAMEIGATPIVLKDTRNDQNYRVGKLPDGRCWMLDNLKYEYGTLATGSITGTEITTPYYADPSSGEYCAGIDTGVYLSGCGYMYNWMAATGGTGFIETEEEEATGDICPGENTFKLPSSYEYSMLSYAIGTTSEAWNPTGLFQGLYSGRYRSSPGSQGSRGLYWSSTSVANDSARLLFTRPEDVTYPAYASDLGAKRNGYAVRCVTKYSDDYTYTAKASAWITSRSTYSPYDDAEEFDIKLDYVSAQYTYQNNSVTGLNPALMASTTYPYALSVENVAAAREIADKVLTTVPGSNRTNIEIMLSDPAKRAANTEHLVDLCLTWGLDGLDVDYEDGVRHWSDEMYGNYKTWLRELKTAMEPHGLILQVDVPMSTSHPDDSLFRYGEIADIADRLGLMAYGNYSYTGASPEAPNTPFGWLMNGVRFAKSEIGEENLDKLVVGLPSFGYYRVMATGEAESAPKKWLEQYIGGNVPVRDPLSGELIWNDGTNIYVMVDTTAMDQKRRVVEQLGVKNVIVWHLGGNDWFSE